MCNRSADHNWWFALNLLSKANCFCWSAFGLQYRWIQSIYILNLKRRWSWMGVTRVFYLKHRSPQLIHVQFETWMVLVLVHFGLGMQMTSGGGELHFLFETEISLIDPRLTWNASGFGPSVFWIWNVNNLRWHFMFDLKCKWFRMSHIWL